MSLEQLLSEIGLNEVGILSVKLMIDKYKLKLVKFEDIM